MVAPAGAIRASASGLESKEGVGPYPGPVDLTFTGELWFWKGPAPWHFITVPEEHCGELEFSSSFVSYGWGMVPVTARIGRTHWQTSLFPKDGHYIVPVKASVRRAERLELGDAVSVRLQVDGLDMTRR